MTTEREGSGECRSSLFGNALDANRRRVDAFINTNSQTDTVTNPGLLTQARSIVNNHAQVTLALRSTQAAGASVYAIEAVNPSPAQLEAVIRDGLVSAVATKEGAKTAGLIKPSAYQAEWRDSATAALDAHQTYARLLELRMSARKGSGQ